ncbi:MAG: DNA-binding response regulator [Planctomycetota bacterium]|nr:MAG: DNA-binding response regulator [Planctomycetota bacterium]
MDYDGGVGRFSNVGLRGRSGVKPVPIRVVLADDHGIVRDGLVAMLGTEPDIAVLGVCDTGEAAYREIVRQRPDVGVLDIAMPGGMTGIEVCRRVRDEGIKTAIVLLSMHEDEDVVRQGLEAGASGYVLKEGAGSELIDAVRKAAEGEVYLSPGVAGSVVGALRQGQGTRPPELSPRERDVLRLLADGLASKEIAMKLGISRRTVDGHRAAIMHKLNIHHVPGLVKYAIRNHLTGLDA